MEKNGGITVFGKYKIKISIGKNAKSAAFGAPLFYYFIVYTAGQGIINLPIPAVFLYRNLKGNILRGVFGKYFAAKLNNAVRRRFAGRKLIAAGNYIRHNIRRFPDAFIIRFGFKLCCIGTVPCKRLCR